MERCARAFVKIWIRCCCCCCCY